MLQNRRSLNFGHFVPNNKALEKKIPENPKYKNVKPAVDSGKSVRKYVEVLKEQQKNCNYKRDEIFRRIKLTSFVKLAIAVGTELLTKDTIKASNEIINEKNEMTKDGKNEQDKKSSQLPMQQSAFSSLLVGIGELDLQKQKHKSTLSPTKCERKLPYLLLDVREPEDFVRCHIITAINYPATQLSRTVSYETVELKEYKNVSGTYIIVYDDDELISSRVAKTLVERGYNNVLLLTGGLKIAYEKFPRGLLVYPSKYASRQNGDVLLSMRSKPKVQEYFTKDDITILSQRLEDYFKSHAIIEKPLCSSACSQMTNYETSRISNHSRSRNSSTKSTLSRKITKSNSMPSTSSCNHQLQKNTVKNISHLKSGKKIPWK